MDKYEELSVKDIDNILKNLPKDLISVENLERLITELDNDIGIQISTKRDLLSILKQFIKIKEHQI